MADSVTRTLLVQEAERRGWRVETLGYKDHYCKITLPDGRWNLFRGTRPMQSSANGFVISKYKHLTMDFVTSLGYKVPPYQLVADDAETKEFLRAQGTVVVKPSDGQRTEGVSVGIDSLEKLEQAVAIASQYSSIDQVLLQRQLYGKLYRLLVINGKLMAAAERRAAHVTGDGQHTIEQLIAITNTDPRRGTGTDTPLKTVDAAAARQLLSEAMDEVPPQGQEVKVLAIDSVSAGGEALNVTEEVHPSWSEFCTKIAHEAGLFVAGYDVICDDIAQPLAESYVPLLEINSSPGLKLHEYPTGGGEPVHLAPLLLDEAFALLQKKSIYRI